jgi:hypothetical protein
MGDTADGPDHLTNRPTDSAICATDGRHLIESWEIIGQTLLFPA